MSDDLLQAGWRTHPSLMTDPLPAVLNLEVTNHCNLRCTHCGHSQYPAFEKGNASLELFERLVPWLRPGGITQLGLSDYGEPLLSPTWKAIFARAKALPDISISFITNGVLLPRVIDLLDHPRLGITVSLDGASEETYGAFRGAGYFEKVVENLRQLDERIRGGALPPIGRHFIVVLSRRNVHEMVEIVRLAAKLGIGLVVFSLQVFFEREQFERESLFFERTLYDRNLREAKAVAAQLGIQLIHTDGFEDAPGSGNSSRAWLYRDGEQVRCGVIETSCYVKFHGQVEGCCVPDRLILGSLAEGDDFEHVWYGAHYRRLRNSFHTGRWLPTCENCNIRQILDVQEEGSHFLIPLRDDGGHVSLPQPYRITEVDRLYREAVAQLAAGGDAVRGAMTALLRLTQQDEELFEACNALAIGWFLLGRRDQALALLRKADRIRPGDAVVRHNLALAGTPAPVSASEPLAGTGDSRGAWHEQLLGWARKISGQRASR